ncbi:MAG: DUF4139 domain-containing protein [Armatimonadetes bacterium]|nr:DUF4139 domain-containing protein [Armatimonadota bacterium]
MMAPRWTVVLLLALATVTFAADLPISRVVLFSSGVGYFEREATIEGDQTVELQFRTAQINDILKSMVLLDFGGGSIAPVTYAPQDPLDRILSSFAVDISDNPNVPELWDRLRGAKARVVTDRTQEGIVFGSEKQQKSVDDKILEFDVLNLMTTTGLVQIPLWHVDSIEILDKDIDSDLRRALEAMDQARDVNKRPVVINFKGEGRRDVRIGYLLETPVWKTSYRLVSDAEGMFLQGWAIVENTTDDDWNNVRLAMVSGRPVSFVQDLYEPLYVERPEVQPSIQRAARPRTYEGAMEEEAKMMAEMAPAAPAEVPPLARRAGAAPMAAPSMAMGMGGGGMAGGMMADRSMALGQFGGTSMAAGEKVGTLFQYAIQQPVTIPRQRSAMIPIINTKVEGEKVSVFNRADDEKHPMNGIQLKNTSDLHLMAGPITVFADNVYGGDALIDDIAPGDKRLLTYAMDLSVEVDTEAKALPEEFLAAKLVRGVLTITRKSRSEMTYTIRNRAKEARTVLVEHPQDDEWKLVQPEKPEETTRATYRFRVEVEPGKTEKLVVVQERPRPDIIVIADQGPDRIEYILRTENLSDEMKATLAKVMEMQSEIAGLKNQLEEKNTRIKEIEQEQNRIRQNMAQLDRNSALYRQYVEKFTNQEAEFDKLREEARALRENIDAKQKALQDYLAGLDIQ